MQQETLLLFLQKDMLLVVMFIPNLHLEMDIEWIHTIVWILVQLTHLQKRRKRSSNQHGIFQSITYTQEKIHTLFPLSLHLLNVEQIKHSSCE